MLPPNEQAKKVVLVTGGARRIGSAIVKRLHQSGFHVVIHYRNSQAEAAQLCLELNQLHPDSAQLCQADLANPAELAPLITQAANFWQRLDALVNNASIFLTSSIGQVTSDQWDYLFNCNVKAPFLLSQKALPYLQTTRGSIINITDIHGTKPMKNYAVYSMTKAALAQQTKCLALEFAPQVRVNAIAPGAILLPEGDSLLTINAQHLKQKIALDRFGDPENIARSVQFLLENDYITGTTITVDGGRLLK